MLTTGGGRLARVDVADDDDVDVSLLLTASACQVFALANLMMMLGALVRCARGWTYPMVTVFVGVCWKVA